MSEWPYARVLAEATAWPFLDGVAFQRGLVALEQTADRALTQPTAELAHALEEWLRTRSGGVSLEVLRQVRDYVWFGQGSSGSSIVGTTRVRLDALLRRAADVLVCEDSGKEAAERAHRQRWYSLALPQDLFVAALLASNPDAQLAMQNPPALDAELRQGVAQLHCHLSAGLSFPALWTYLMTTVGNSQVDRQRMDKTDAPLGGRDEFLDWLAAAGLARLTLAQFLYGNKQRGTAPPLTFQTFLTRQSFGGPVEQREHLGALTALHHGDRPLSAARTQAAYRRYLSETSALSSCRSLDDLATADPVGRCFQGEPAEHLSTTEPAWAESRFCTRALQYLQTERGQKDGGFERLFWQYQRVRCTTFRFVTHDPGTRGLDWFVRFFTRISPLRRGLRSDVLMDAVIRNGSVPSGQSATPVPPRKVEVRIGPKSRWDKLREEIDLIGLAGCQADAAGNSKPVTGDRQRGVVLHFQKDGPDTVPEARAGGAQGYGNAFVRFGRQFVDKRKEAHAVAALLDADPSRLRILRGLDVCGRELTQPTWLLLPLLHDLRKRSEDLAHGPRGLGKGSGLRMTLHAGEDFRTLLEGLRRIHEPIQFDLLRRCDRIGHAVALGIDAQDWVQQHPVAYQPAEERLEDLLWLCDIGVLCAQRHAAAQRMVEELWSLAQRIYALPWVLNPGYVLRALLKARHRRHHPHFLSDWNYPELNLAPTQPTPFSATDFLLRHLTDVGVWLRGQEPVEVCVKDELRAIRAAQRVVQRAVRCLDLTIEANPTSNLLIAELGSVDQHPIFRLAPLSRRRWLSPKYRIALSDDDPLTFATSLLDEYRYTYFAILRQGYGESAAINWLKARRTDAMRAAFTLPT